MKKHLVISGDTFHEWTVVKEDRKVGKHRLFLCKCSCGEINKVYLTHLVSGKSKGCKNCNQKTHGHYGDPPYYSWRAMKRRCYNKSDKDYKYYGGKGISVCDEWLNNFGKFRTWAISNGFVDGLVIDRKNPLLGYTPENCRWITGTENTKLMLMTRTYRPCQCGL